MSGRLESTEKYWYNADNNKVSEFDQCEKLLFVCHGRIYRA